MAFTKVVGAGIHTLSNITSHNIHSSGIVTATGLDISGNATIGGVLTYEDVTSIDSVGLITARNGIDCNADLDVDGHTNLDNVNIAGVSTFTGISNHSSRISLLAGNAVRFHNASNSASSEIKCDGGARLHLTSYNQTMATFENGQATVFYTNSGQNRLQINNDGNILIAKDLSVDGHTNLDNVSVAGVSTFSEGVIIPDSKALSLGNRVVGSTTGDLRLYHDGSNSYIDEIGSGNLYIRNNSNTSIFCQTSGSVELYENGSKKFETSASGATVTGTQTITGKLLIGTTTAGSTSADEITVEGSGIMGMTLRTDDGSTGQSNVYFADGTSGTDRYTGYITYQHQYDRFRFGVNGGQLAVQINKDKSLNLYAGLSVSGITTATGADINGDIDVDGHTNLDNVSVAGVTTTTDHIHIKADNKQLRIGAHNDGDMLSYHDGNKSVIVNYTGDFHIRSNNGSRSSLEGIILKPSGATQLHHSGSKKLETASTGANVIGNLDVINGHVYINDNYKAYFGTNNDLEIFHNDDDAYIRNNKGALILRNNGQTGDADASQIYIQATPAENSIQCSPNGAVTLYHDNLRKLSTTNTGIEIHANEGNNANIGLTADEGDDNGDQWLLQSQASTNNFNIYNDTSGSLALKLSLKPNGDLQVINHLQVNGGKLTLEDGNEQQIHRFWTNGTDSDIYGLLSGSVFGTIVEGAHNGHHVVALRDNDAADSFAIVSGGGDYQTDTTYDKLVARFRSNGYTEIGGELHVSSEAVINSTLRVVDAITHVGDSNTRIRFPENDAISFETAGNERVRITSDGVFSMRSSSTPLSGSSNNYSVNIYRDSGSGYGYLDTVTGSSNSTGVRIRTYNNTTYNNVIEHTTSKVTNFQTNGLTRLSITSGGIIQIGNTENPTNYNVKDIMLGNHSGHHGITILSGTSSGGYIMFSDNNGGGSNAYRGQIEYQHGGSDPDHMRFITATQERLRIKSNGEVWFKDGKLKLGTTSGTDNYIYSTNAAGIIYQADENGHRFQTYSGGWQDRLIIKDDGIVNIGVSSPQYAKKVNIQGDNGYTLSLSNQDYTGHAADTFSGIEGRIQCGGGVWTSAGVRFVKHNGTSGDKHSRCELYSVDGYSNKIGLIVQPDGEVTKPLQPRALVEIYSTTTISNGKVTNWASPVFNVRDLWDTTNKRFVAPIAGLYLVGGNFRIGAPGKVRVVRFMLNVYDANNSLIAAYGGGTGGGNNYDGGSGGYDHPYVSFTNAIYLSENHYLELHLAEVGTEHTTYIQQSSNQSSMWCVLLN